MGNNKARPNNINTVMKVIKMVKKLKPGYLSIILLTKLIAAADPFIKIIFGSIILDKVIEKDTVRDIMFYVCILIACNCISALSRWGLEAILVVQKRIITERINQMICERSLSLDYDILEKKETLEMIQKANEGMQSHGDIGSFCEQLGYLIERLCRIIYSIVLLIGLYIPVMTVQTKGISEFMNAWYSGFSVFLIMLLTLIVEFYLKRWTGKQEQKSFEKNVEGNRRFSYFFEFIYNYIIGKDIRLYRMKDMIMDEIHQDNLEREANINEMTRSYNKASVIEQILSFVFEGASYIYVGLKAIFGLISIGSVLKYVGAFRELSNSLGGLLDIYIGVEIRSRYLAYFSDFMDIKNKKQEGTLPIKKRDNNEYEIEFRNVSFHYPNCEDMVLSHVNAKLKAGQKIAVVGKNGAGKTTFIKLLCRLYDPTEGEILLNGININQYDYKEYMKLFSIVFQDFQLFSFTLAENVASSSVYEEERVENCLEKAGFGERLKTMPEGIETNIYQLKRNGVEISGGEAQKIAIARALYKDSPFVVLDEPTSALDPVSEYDIYKRFDDLVREKTAIYISHRMSSCRFCDHIVVFNEGNIIQNGCHDELLKDTENVYYQLWNAQAQYYA